jgi:hypothetical protein
LHPACKIQVIGYGVNSEEGYQVMWDKISSVIDYILAKGVDSSRLIFTYGVEGPATIVELKALKMMALHIFLLRIHALVIIYQNQNVASICTEIIAGKYSRTTIR